MGLIPDIASIRDKYLTLHGRIDDEVKVQGIRVNLREIESELEENPDVNEAAAILGGVNNEKIIVYYASKEGTNYVPELPKATYDHEFCIVSSLPRSSSGKKDRKKLSGDHRK